MTGTDIEFVYVGDPMCSWCWGMAPVLQKLSAHYAIPMRIVVGGLRPGASAQPLDEETRATLLHHWEQVESASGQPFDRTGLDRADWVYDTEFPARAVVTMRNHNEPATLEFFEVLQRAFYAEAIDITEPAPYPRLAGEFVADDDAYMSDLRAEASREAAWHDFAEARRLGVSGFPTLLLRFDARYLVVTRGYLPWQQLEPALTGWLRDNHPDASELIAAR